MSTEIDEDSNFSGLRSLDTLMKTAEQTSSMSAAAVVARACCENDALAARYASLGRFADNWRLHGPKIQEAYTKLLRADDPGTIMDSLMLLLTELEKYKVNLPAGATGKAEKKVIFQRERA